LRGAGLLLLVPNSKLWHQLSKPLCELGGSCNIRSTTYSRYTVAQLMTKKGLHMQAGKLAEQASLVFRND
jgi:hypothetical protein